MTTEPESVAAALQVDGGRQQYQPLVEYLTDGFRRNRSPSGSGARYKGVGSVNGPAADEMEAFSRLAPFWSAWLAGGGNDNRIRDILTRGIVEGTNPSSSGYWGSIGDRDQRLCEASDIAIALWLARNWIEDAMTPAAWMRVMRWLREGAVREVNDSNWHLFPATVAAVLESFSIEGSAAIMRPHLARIAEFAVGNGLFRDGPNGRIDWYNAWGFHYNLGMLEAIAGSDALTFGRRARTEMLPLLLHLTGPNGVPIFGRSIHYRGATPAPLAISAMLKDGGVPHGQARRAVRLVWLYHLERGMLQHGTISQGYHGADILWVDAYSGPASPLWSLRSLIPVLRLPASDEFWTKPELPLPVETSDYRLKVQNCFIEGDHRTGEVRLKRRGRHRAPVKLERYGLAARLRNRLRGWGTRPANIAVRYELPVYSSLHPFCVAGAGKPRS